MGALDDTASADLKMLGKLCNGAGVGIIQYVPSLKQGLRVQLMSRVTAQVYVMEICPNRIRGGMEAFSAVWYVLTLQIA